MRTAVLFSAFARTVQQQDDPGSTLVEIVRAAVELVPGCDEGSISVVLGRRRVTSQAPPGDLPRVVDALQEKLGQGPCLDAAYEQETVRVSDMAIEQRWPLFTRGALEAGAAGMLSFQLYVEGDNLGALNLFTRRRNAFDDESEHVGLLFAAHAAVAYSAAQQQASAARVVATRQLIGRAEGILMERHKLTADQAFALLVRASQQGNVKLRDVASRLVHSGALPGPDTAAPGRRATHRRDRRCAARVPARASSCTIGLSPGDRSVMVLMRGHRPSREEGGRYDRHQDQLWATSRPAPRRCRARARVSAHGPWPTSTAARSTRRSRRPGGCTTPPTAPRCDTSPRRSSVTR